MTGRPKGSKARPKPWSRVARVAGIDTPLTALENPLLTPRPLQTQKSMERTAFGPWQSTLVATRPPACKRAAVVRVLGRSNRDPNTKPSLGITLTRDILEVTGFREGEALLVSAWEDGVVKLERAGEEEGLE